ncbi:MAG TPA: protein kinase [Gemmataceae bacterium]|nr:protein kinase [Gemmataceae bacterium]
MSSPDPMSLSSAYPPAPPGYELLEEIGRGGMGVVWRAHERRLNREVAVKLLREDCSTGAQARFLFEATVTGQLQHPGIPAVHELGTLPDGRPFLAMKLVKGRTLHELLGSVRLSPRPRGGEGRGVRGKSPPTAAGSSPFSSRSATPSVMPMPTASFTAT